MKFINLNDPWMFKCLFGTWSLVLVLGEKLGDEVLSIVRDIGPDSVLE